MNEHCIAIIGASYLQLPLITKAKEMGYKTHVFAWQNGDVGEKAADYFYPISIIEKERILEICEKIAPSGICSIASDLAVPTVNYIANVLGLPGNSIECSRKSTNKHLMRRALEKRLDPSPKSFLVDAESDLGRIDIDFPVIVKPIDRSGSRGVCKVSCREDLKKAVVRAANQSFEHKSLIEEYVEGKEYSVEYISYQGRHYYLALTKKYTTGSPFFIERGHLEPAIIENCSLNKVKEVVEHALDTLEIKNGASHTEIKVSDSGKITIIEIGARMGGDCIGSDLVKLSTGYDYVRMVIDVSTGNPPNFTKCCEPQKVESIYMISEKDVQEYYCIKNTLPDRIIRLVDFHPERIGSTTDSSNRVGCYIRRVGN